MDSVSCFLRTHHFWKLPLPCWPPARRAYGSESVALPSGNGGHFMTSGLPQKLGKCAMPGAHGPPRRKRTGYQNGLISDYIWGDTWFPPKPLFRVLAPPQADGVRRIDIYEPVCIGNTASTQIKWWDQICQQIFCIRELASLS